MDESLFSKELLQCPICLNEIEATVWDVIEADTDPDLKEKLLRKDLQTQQCLNCGHAWIPARPMLYRDTAGKMIIYCRSGQTEEQARAILAKVPVLPGWNLRLVADYNQLIEKIHIADHRCDDRLVEFIKLAVKRQGVEDQDAAIAQLFFLTADDQTFRFLVSSEDGGWYTLDLESQIYLNAETLTEGRLGDNAGQWQVVGEAFAEALLKKLAE